MSTAHLPPHLPRRSFLKLGLVGAAVLAVAGGAALMLHPALVNGAMSSSSRLVMSRVGQSMLKGLLPADPAAQAADIEALLTRTDAFLAGLPNHVVAELDQLLGLLASAPGRRLLVGLTPSWQDASVDEVTAALRGMRDSGNALRIQAFQGLHDIVFVPYFSGESTWKVLGYPGPVVV
jgi:hypothetical protein